MTNETEIKNNAMRLGFSLDCISEDSRAIHLLANILHYEPEQLKTDCHDIWKYLQQANK